jgi:hypothetical protein
MAYWSCGSIGLASCGLASGWLTMWGGLLCPLSLMLDRGEGEGSRVGVGPSRSLATSSVEDGEDGCGCEEAIVDDSNPRVVLLV